MHQYIEAPSQDRIKNKHSIFLGGGISNCADWQKLAAKEFAQFDHLTVINPRRENYNCDDPSQERIQITWEHEKLREVSQLFFYFAPETLCPITLFEYGSALERFIYCKNPEIIFVGVHPDYKRKNDILIQTELMTNRVIVNNSLAEVIQEAVKYNKILNNYLHSGVCPLCKGLPPVDNVIKIDFNSNAENL